MSWNQSTSVSGSNRPHKNSAGVIFCTTQHTHALCVDSSCPVQVCSATKYEGTGLGVYYCDSFSPLPANLFKTYPWNKRDRRIISLSCISLFSETEGAPLHQIHIVLVRKELRILSLLSCI